MQNATGQAAAAPGPAPTPTAVVPLCLALSTLSSLVQATAELPVMHDSRTAFAEAFLRGASPYALITLLPEMARGLGNVRSFSVLKTVTLLEEVERETVATDRTSMVWELFHAIPRTVLQSLMLGTVAYDASSMRGYDTDGPGVYLLSISISGRNGRFLTRLEMETLIENMQDYFVGAELTLGIYTEPQGQPPLPQNRKDELKKLTAEINVVYVKISKGSKKAHPYFASVASDDATKLNRGCTRFLDRLKSQAEELRKLDPGGAVKTLQLPLYVGCGQNIKTRVKKYEVKTGNHLADANAFYTLMLSLLKHQGLVPKRHVVGALRTWKDGHMKVAEQLVAALALSYPDFGGLNWTEAEDHPSKFAITRQHKLQVFQQHPFLKVNIKHSIEDIEARERFADARLEIEHHVAMVESRYPPEDLLPQLRHISRDIKNQHKELDSRIERLNNQKTQAEDVADGADGLREILLELQDIMLSSLSEDEESGEDSDTHEGRQDEPGRRKRQTLS